MTSLTFLWLILCRGTSYSRIMGRVIHMVKLAVFVAHIASNREESRIRSADSTQTNWTLGGQT